MRGLKQRLAACIIVAMLAPALAWAELSQQDERLAQYLAGCELLNQAAKLGAGEKKKRFAQLTEITGVDSVRAYALIQKYRGKPDQWNPVLERVRALVEDTTGRNGK